MRKCGKCSGTGHNARTCKGEAGAPEERGGWEKLEHGLGVMEWKHTCGEVLRFDADEGDWPHPRIVRHRVECK